MERAQRGPSDKVSGRKGPREPNGEGPEGPSGKISGPKGPFTTNGEGPEGPGGKVSGPKGPCACLFFAPLHVLFFKFHSIYVTLIMPLPYF